jgi:high potential iron-sulfur protein
LSKIARRQFIQLSAVAAAGYLVRPGAEARAEGLPHLTEDDPTAQSLKYVHASTTEGQVCANCALIQGTEGDPWRPCQIFPGKLVNADGWCSVWAAKT